MRIYRGIQNCVVEWSYVSTKTYTDPFRDVELDVIFADPDGEERRVPAFWAGENAWRVRYASPKVGRHRYRTICSDADNEALHGQEGELEVQPYEGDNPLLRHGPLRVAESRRYLEHGDGTPFFWLGDTWWYGLVREFRWPGEFQELVADRVAKGFNLIQIVVGYLPGAPERDARCGNEGGFPWTEDYRTINPRFFDMADLRIDYLVRNGLVPCIVGSWGYWLLRLGVEGFKRHWRYLVARYGAYPVVWCLCGEVTTTYPDAQTWEGSAGERNPQLLKEGWSDVCRYLGQVDPYGHPITAHPRGRFECRDMLDEDAPLTVCMLQTGHSFIDLPGMLALVRRARERGPCLPVINGECVYEGIRDSSWQDVQRFVAWSCVLNGAAGHTYGAAEGCWHIIHDGPFPFTHGLWHTFDDWREIAALPGSGQMGHLRRLMERYEWGRFEPHPEWVEVRGENDGCFVPHAAGIPGKVRVIYTSPPSYTVGSLSAVVGLESEVAYRAYLYDPRTGAERDLGPVEAEGGRWPQPPRLPDLMPFSHWLLDWVIVLEVEGARVVSQA